VKRIVKGYTSDLAYIHDVGFGSFSERAAPALLRILRDSGVRRGLVVDLGCGSGLWAHRLVEQGYDVLGIDISAAMVKLARRREPRARFKVGSFLSVPLPRCVAITAIGECLSYLFDERNGEETLAGFFARAHEALEPDGVLVFDVLESGRGVPCRNAERYAGGRDWAVLVKVQENVAARQLTREITSFRRVGKLYRRVEEVHGLRLLSKEAVERKLRRQGFSVKVVRGYGELRFPRGHVGFVARRR